jgi:imidazolonepropionase
MSTGLITNIKCLYGTDNNQLRKGAALAALPFIENAYLLIEDDEIAAFGKMESLPGTLRNQPATDASSRLVLPAWCDSHSHMVFTGFRENEFVDKIKGATYAEIAGRGGGILHSARTLAEISEDALFVESWKRLAQLSAFGTAAIEIKSGYGLNIEDELKMLRVIRRLKEKSSLLIKSTFLGAHTYPPAFKENHDGYVDQVINEMLPLIAAEQLADFIDVFCEVGFFSPSEMERICAAGKRFGLKPKLHVNQLNSIGGIQAGIRCNALSLDHLETLTPQDITDIQSAYKDGWQGLCTLLPTAAFFLRMPYQPARALIEAGAAIALASDYNPGSSPAGNMNFVVALSCIQMRMLPEEAINAATINGAYAMEIHQDAGSIAVGKKANLIITRPVPSLAYLPYAFGDQHIERVMVAGEFIS